VGAAIDMAVSPLKRGREFSARIFGSVAGDMTINSMGGVVDSSSIDAREPTMSRASKAMCRPNTRMRVRYLGSPHLLDSSMFSVSSCEIRDI
jgi:hypothetical protein